MLLTSNKKLFMAACITGTGFFSSCGKDESDSNNDSNAKQLSISLEKLGDLGKDFVYEGWAITDAGPVSTGRFSMTDANEVKTFDISEELATQAKTFVLTIEPSKNDVPAPAKTHLLAGDIKDGKASLTLSHAAALATDFTTAKGSYILETPSTASNTGDFNQGVWFLKIEDGPQPSLTLPTLPEGWVYEGWVVDKNGAVSTGTFSVNNKADSDGAGTTAGADATPAFPGQDFITPARVVTGGALVISVEPSPDNAATPFFLKPLEDGKVDAVAAGVSQDLSNKAAVNNAKGTIEIK